MLLLLAAPVARAQTAEIGLMGGVMYYHGDLNNVHFKNSNISGGLFYRYNINQRLAFRINFLYGNVDAADSDARDPVKINRNLSFKSSITELAGMMEFHYYKYSPGSKLHWFSTYLLTGIAYFRMNPKAKLGNVWYELNALSTEGQGLEGGPKRYKLDAFAIPVGLGAKFNIGKRVSISVEYSIRFTFTDYLDDVSGTYFSSDRLEKEVGNVTVQLADRRIDKTAPVQDATGQTLGLQRGDPSRNDWYGFAGLFFSFRIGKDPNTCARWN